MFNQYIHIFIPRLIWNSDNIKKWFFREFLRFDQASLFKRIPYKLDKQKLSELFISKTRWGKNKRNVQWSNYITLLIIFFFFNILNHFWVISSINLWLCDLPSWFKKSCLIKYSLCTFASPNYKTAQMSISLNARSFV